MLELGVQSSGILTIVNVSHSHDRNSANKDESNHHNEDDVLVDNLILSVLRFYPSNLFPETYQN